MMRTDKGAGGVADLDSIVAQSAGLQLLRAWHVANDSVLHAETYAIREFWRGKREGLAYALQVIGVDTP